MELPVDYKPIPIIIKTADNEFIINAEDIRYITFKSDGEDPLSNHLLIELKNDDIHIIDTGD